MQRLAILACLLAIWSSGRSQARAQDVEDAPSAVERWHPEAFGDPEGARRPANEAQQGVRRAKIGVGVSVAATVAGALMVGGAVVSTICFADDCISNGGTTTLAAVGSTFIAVGLAGVIVSSIKLRRRKRGSESRALGGRRVARRERVP